MIFSECFKIIEDALFKHHNELWEQAEKEKNEEVKEFIRRKSSEYNNARNMILTIWNEGKFDEYLTEEDIAYWDAYFDED